MVNNITSDNVVVHIESEKERLNTNAETYIRLGDTLKALATYRELVDKFPDDWRGWWGLIYYHYDCGIIHGLYSSGEQAELEHQMALFKKIAPQEEYEKLDEVIKARIAEVRAAIEIEKENLELMSDLNSLVDNSIAIATQQIEEIIQHLSVVRENYNRLNLELKQAVSTRESIEAADKQMKKRSDRIFVLLRRYRCCCFWYFGAFRWCSILYSACGLRNCGCNSIWNFEACKYGTKCRPN